MQRIEVSGKDKGKPFDLTQKEIMTIRDRSWSHAKLEKPTLLEVVKQTIRYLKERELKKCKE